MRPSIPLPLSLLTILTTTTAFPLVTPFQAYHNILPRENVAPRASYSVVAVDGGSSATAAAASPTTVTDLRTQTQTQLSTIVITQGASPTTIVVTVTSASTPTIIETPPTNTPALQASPVTVTVTDSTMPTAAPETRPYDDGQWHTTYFYTVETPAPTPNLEAAGAPSPGGFDDGSWAKWAGNSGQWQAPPKA